MPKFQFDKSKKKITNKRSPRPITKTNISKPREMYDPTKVDVQIEHEDQQKNKKRPVGRPKSGRKVYQTIRLQKQTVLKLNALENALGISTQDETVERALDRILNSLSTDEKRSYELWLDVFEKKDKN